MEHRILLISTYPELTKRAQRISRILGIPLTIHEGGILKNGHVYAKRVETDFDVIISVAATASSIEKIVTIPVVSIEISTIDFLDALVMAKEYGDKIALVSHKTEQLSSIQRLKNIMNIEFFLHSYSNKEELEKQIEDAMAIEKITIVGMGSCITEIAKEKCLNAVLIKSSIREITKAIISAKNISDLGKREKEKAKGLSTIIDYSGEGIIGLDKEMNITTFNPFAEKILSINADDVMGHSILSYTKDHELGALYENGSQEIGKLIKLNNIQVVVNRLPLIVDNEQIGMIFTLQEVSKIQKIEQKVRAELYSKGLVARYTFNDVIGQSSSVLNTIARAIKFGKTNTTILIQGETGCGKEVFAQSIHNVSSKKDGPFVAVNCAAFPDNLLESELFGYEEGAFTGARKGGKMGLFELAHGGTIFLDEISEIPLNFQARLLRVLQEKMILKIGSDHIINVDIRIIAASNRDLSKLVAEGKFREDLFFRLNVLNLWIPPLRERKEDIPVLVKRIIRMMNQKHHSNIECVTEKGIEVLKAYGWPGNVRELENFVEKMIVLLDIPIVDESHIKQFFNERCNSKDIEYMKKIDTQDGIIVEVGQLKDMEMQIIEAISKKVNGDKALLAERLGISRTTLWKRLKELEEYSG